MIKAAFFINVPVWSSILGASVDHKVQVNGMVNKISDKKYGAFIDDNKNYAIADIRTGEIVFRSTTVNSYEAIFSQFEHDTWEVAQ